MAVRVLITDDHGVVRQGLKMFLSLDPGLEVVGEAANGDEALRMARDLSPDVVLMDLVMPAMDGISATGAIRSELPDVEVIALTSVLEDASVTGAVKAGAIGYLMKDTEAEELGRAIKAAAEGRVYLAPEAAAPHARGPCPPECRIPHRTRDGGAPTVGAGQGEQADLVKPLRHREDGQGARLEHPGEAGREQPHPGRPLRRARRAGEHEGAG